MTSAQVREHREQWWASPAVEEVLDSVIDALEQYEREAEARAGMPELRYEWGVLGQDGRFSPSSTRKAACNAAEYWNRHDDRCLTNPYRAVRLAVVEVVEPEPEKPTREVGPSGWEYERKDHGSVPYVEIRCRDGRSPGNAWRSDAVNVPDCDRALVARLLGEGV